MNPSPRSGNRPPAIGAQLYAQTSEVPNAVTDEGVVKQIPFFIEIRGEWKICTIVSRARRIFVGEVDF